MPASGTPITVAAVAFVVCLFFLPETKDVDIFQ